MTKQTTFALLFGLMAFCFSSITLMGQKATLNGVITDDVTGEALIGATVQAGEVFTVTDFDGAFDLELDKGEYTLLITYLNNSMSRNVIMSGENQRYDIAMNTSIDIDEVVVTVGRFEKNQLETDISIETLNVDMIERNSAPVVSEVLDRVPGLTMIENQADIRGGSGFSYGAGSRVMVLQNDIPALSFDAAYPNWDDFPLENVAQIEVAKGAASALYGSSALNGIINIRTAYAKSEPETDVSSFIRYYMKPQTDSLAWWKDQEQPHEVGTSLAHRQKIGKLDVVAGAYWYQQNSFRKDTNKKFGRGSFSLRYNFSPKFYAGVNGSGTKGSNRFYLFWKGVGDLLEASDIPGLTSEGKTFRYLIDPFVNYMDDNGNRHRLTGRFADLRNEASQNRGSESKTWFTEYQYKRQFEDLGIGVVSGLVFTHSKVEAELYQDRKFKGNNYAAYLQLEKKILEAIDRPLTFSFGARYEYNDIFALDSLGQKIPDLANGKDSTKGRPVFRAGVNFRPFKYSSIRASFGQGFRYPTIIEKYVRTSLGPLAVKENIDLQSETGWNAELGFKQAWAMGDQRIRGFMDLALFWTEYTNMTEFVFLAPTEFAFQAQNVGDTQIKGFEVSIAGEGDIAKDFSASFLAGYTYIDPIYKLNRNESILNDSTLKYRFEHSLKADVEFKFKDISFGVNALYLSHMKSIDTAFSDFLPGVAEFRETHNSGTKVFDFRLGYQVTEQFKVNLLLKNALNEEYAIRPGLMDAPRSITFRVDGKF